MTDRNSQILPPAGDGKHYWRRIYLNEAREMGGVFPEYLFVGSRFVMFSAGTTTHFLIISDEEKR